MRGGEVSEATTYDFSNLSEKISGLTGALIGRGASEGDLQKVLTVRAGRLHAAIGDAIGPKTKESAQKKIEWEMKRHLTTAPEYINNDWTPEKSESSYADFTWLTAGHGKNGKFVLGINDEDMQMSADAAGALAFLRTGQKSADRGDAYQRLGQRGTSKKDGGTGRINVMRLNRVKVSKSAFAGVKKTLMDLQGELRASFYRVAKHYAPSIRVPAWLENKFGQVAAKGKSEFRDSLGPGDPFAFIESTVRAPGVQSNPALAAKIQGAINNEAEVVFAILKKVISGYKYKFATGQTFRSEVNEEGVI